MTPVELLLSKLPDAKRNGKSWYARCPAHDDRRPSLSIAEGDDGRALVHCHTGCTTQAIIDAMGLNLIDLMPANSGNDRQVVPTSMTNGKSGNTFATAGGAIAALERKYGQRSASWWYDDVEGQQVGIVIRWDTPQGKDVRPVSRTSDGRWIIGGMIEPRPLYGLSDLLKSPKSSRIYVCEGEKSGGLGARRRPDRHHIGAWQQVGVKDRLVAVGRA